MKKKLTALILIMVMLLGCLTPVSAASGTQINKESLTIESGSSYQLQVTVNGRKATAYWGSSNSSVATVSSSGKVTGKAAGSAIITAMVNGQTVECLVSVLKKSSTATTRYNVLVLDASGSMRGRPDSSQKEAAKRFCSKVLSTSGNNYVAVVSLHSGASILCGFTNNYNQLATAINKVRSSGTTNMNKALATAGQLLNGVTKSGSNVMKNIVLCSDGLPTTGSRTASGKYSSSTHSYYQYANSTYNTATQLKNKNYFIYALGFFHSSTGNDLKFGKQLMKDLASKDKYYVINSVNDLNTVFDDIANKITKVTINKSSITIYKNNTYQLYAMKNGAKTTASWKSSNSSVASVNSSGKVTGKKAGTATITATVNGKNVTCKVTVKNKVSMKLNKTSITLYVGDKTTLKATVSGTSSGVTWKSKSSSIASVSGSGVVTAKKVGKTTITATVGGVTKTCAVTVKQKYKYAGKVTNALNGNAVSGATVSIRKGHNAKKSAVYAKTTTSSTGEFSVKLPQGNYTIAVSKSGYITTYTNIYCTNKNSNAASNINYSSISISPVQTTGDFRIVLTWGASPRDLDSHLVGPNGSGGTFHVYFAKKYFNKNYSQVAKLDIDDTTWYGPETITISKSIASSGTFRYYVKDYTNGGRSSSTALSYSGAKIVVYRGNVQVATFNVPRGKAGYIWNVFNIVNGRVVPVNTVTSVEKTY